jgi:SAM-dependent methyltransferase
VNREYVTYQTDMGRPVGAPTAEDGRARARVLRHHLRSVLPLMERGPAADIACGRGEAMLALRVLGFAPVIGCEIGAQQLRACREAGLQVVDEDAVTFAKRLPPQALVTALDIIEHLEEAEGEALLSAIQNGLRPGGWLVVQCPNPASPFFGSVQYGDPTHRAVIGPGSLLAKLRRAGFARVVILESEPVPHGPKSVVRALLWKGIRSGMRLYDAIETGSMNGGPYTRVLLAAAEKMAHP